MKLLENIICVKEENNPKYHEKVIKNMVSSIKLDKEQQLVVADRNQLEKWNNYQCVINYPGAQQVKTNLGSIVYKINKLEKQLQ
jgi:hypothetical protein